MCHVTCHGSYPVNSDAAGGCQHDFVSIALEVCFVACTIMVCALRGLNCVADAAATECFNQKAHAYTIPESTAQAAQQARKMISFRKVYYDCHFSAAPQ